MITLSRSLSSQTLGMGQKFIEVPLEMPMWCFQAVKFMAADATARDLINLGVVAVSGIPVLSMTPTDATYYAEALRYCTAPIVDVQYVSLQSYPPRPLQPILDAPPERTGPGRRPAATTVDDASIPSGAALLGLGVPRGPPMVGELRYDEAEGLLKRPLMRDCTEEQFMADLGAFWRVRFIVYCTTTALAVPSCYALRFAKFRMIPLRICRPPRTRPSMARPLGAFSPAGKVPQGQAL